MRQDPSRVEVLDLDPPQAEPRPRPRRRMPRRWRVAGATGLGAVVATASLLHEPTPPTPPDDRDTLNGPKYQDAIPYERRAAQRRAAEEPLAAIRRVVNPWA